MVSLCRNGNDAATTNTMVCGTPSPMRPTECDRGSILNGIACGGTEGFKQSAGSALSTKEAVQRILFFSCHDLGFKWSNSFDDAVGEPYQCATSTRQWEAIYLAVMGQTVVRQRHYCLAVFHRDNDFSPGVFFHEIPNGLGGLP